MHWQESNTDYSWHERSEAQAVKSFQVTLAAVQKGSRACKAAVGKIATTACFEAPKLPASGQLPSFQETCGNIAAHHQEVRSF